MAHIIADRVKETTTTTGTGQITLLGASIGTRTFNSQMANNDTCYYCIDGGLTGQWEVGLGTYADTDLLTRTTIYSNSNGDTAPVNFTDGDKDVFITNPAEAMANLPFFTSGTFTPAITGTTSAGTATYATATGVYKKLGSMVFISYYIAYSSHTGTGNLTVTGLPFTASSIVSFPLVNRVADLTFTGQIQLYVTAGTSTVVYQVAASGSATSLAMDAAATIAAAGWYYTD